MRQIRIAPRMRGAEDAFRADRVVRYPRPKAFGPELYSVATL
jgi:hypothetical protein